MTRLRRAADGRQSGGRAETRRGDADRALEIGIAGDIAMAVRRRIAVVVAITAIGAIRIRGTGRLDGNASVRGRGRRRGRPLVFACGQTIVSGDARVTAKSAKRGFFKTKIARLNHKRHH